LKSGAEVVVLLVKHAVYVIVVRALNLVGVVAML
jgi:hypothetical protein